MTTTSGTSLIDRLTSHQDPLLIARGNILKNATRTYWTTKIDGIITPVEIVDGLRVLGAPIGSVKFCQQFLLKALSRAQSDATKLINNLEDLQTTLSRLFSTCTAHKITHLFAHDVYNTKFDELPNNFWLWNSDLTDKFSEMTADLLANITNQQDLPVYSQLISNISISQGGLGIQSP
jgi:hypothetical protein